MLKKLMVNLMIIGVMLGLLFTVSCAKKEITTDFKGAQTLSAEEIAARNAAKAAELERQQKAREGERMLQEQALREAEEDRKNAARRRFENQDIHFAYDSAELTPMSQMLLKEKAAWLEEQPGLYVEIQGHCDERGTTEYNLALGERRALAVKRFLVDLGIIPSRMSIISYGEEKPLALGHDETAWAKNRRAHSVIR